MNSTPDTRYSLIGKLADPQDAEAWAEFAAIYQPLIFRITKSRGLQHADATDVTQEVLAKVMQAIGRFDGSRANATFRGWLYRITRNLVVDFVRRCGKNPVVLVEGFPEANTANPTADESAEFHRAFQRQVFLLVSREVRGTVKPQTWDAFWQTEVEQRSATEVAEELGLSVGAIYVARSRVLARLRKEAQRRISETGFTVNDGEDG